MAETSVKVKALWKSLYRADWYCLPKIDASFGEGLVY